MSRIKSQEKTYFFEHLINTHADKKHYVQDVHTHYTACTHVSKYTFDEPSRAGSLELTIGFSVWVFGLCLKLLTTFFRISEQDCTNCF